MGMNLSKLKIWSFRKYLHSIIRCHIHVILAPKFANVAKGKQNVAPGNHFWNSAEERQEVTCQAKICSHFCNFRMGRIDDELPASNLITPLFESFNGDVNSLSARPAKWLNMLKQFVSNLSTNCLSVFDHFVVLALKGLKFFSNL